MIEFDSAGWACVIVLEPVLDAGFIESMAARKLDALGSLLALL